MDSVKINSLEIENVKRIKAVKIEPTANGLTVIGGKNAQGKTSVLDSIAWALGGDKYRPSMPTREGATTPLSLSITLSNGLVVERNGRNSDLKVTDPAGQRAGQTLLNTFIGQFALNIPKFMGASDKEKANILLQIIGVGDELVSLEAEENELYKERTVVGRVADQKEKYAEEQAYFSDAPSEPISVAELIQRQQEILLKNAENQKKRENVSLIESQLSISDSKINQLVEQICALQSQLENEKKTKDQLVLDLATAKTDILSLQDESTAEIEESIRNIEEINKKVQANIEKEKALESARVERRKYNELTTALEDVRSKKKSLLLGANLPLPELSVENGFLTYKGQRWDNMSGSERLKVSTAIVRQLHPQCGFVLLDKLEQLDVYTMNEFGRWLEQQGLQAIATRVSTDNDECSIIIEDGYVKEEGVINANDK